MSVWWVRDMQATEYDPLVSGARAVQDDVSYADELANGPRRMPLGGRGLPWWRYPRPPPEKGEEGKPGSSRNSSSTGNTGSSFRNSNNGNHTTHGGNATQGQDGGNVEVSAYDPFGESVPCTHEVINLNSNFMALIV